LEQNFGKIPWFIIWLTFGYNSNGMPFLVVKCSVKRNKLFLELKNDYKEASLIIWCLSYSCEWLYLAILADHVGTDFHIDYHDVYLSNSLCCGLNREMTGDVQHTMRLNGDGVIRSTIGSWSWARSSLTVQPKVPRLARWVMQG
jgi:hypothetical protein